MENYRDPLSLRERVGVRVCKTKLSNNPLTLALSPVKWEREVNL